MKTIIHITIAVFGVLPFKIWSQDVAGEVQGTGTDMNARPYGIVQEIGFDEPPTLGSAYLIEDWTLGQINLIGRGPLNDYTFKYDIENNLFEIKIDGSIKFIQGRRISNFNFTNPLTGSVEFYINASEQDYNGSSPYGFIHKIHEGKEFSLFSKTYIVKEKGQYIAALDVGDRTNKIVKKITYYYLHKNSLQRLIIKSKKKFSNQFERSTDVLEFIKVNNLKVKSTDHLNKIFEFLNQY